MSRAVSINNIKKAFEKKITTNVALVNTSRKLQSTNSKGLKPKQVEQITGLAFLSIMAGWEDFIEGCMVRYLKGNIANSSGRIQSKLGHLSDLNLAYKILGGYKFERGKDYLNFSDLKQVEDMANVYFKIHPFHPTADEKDLVKNMYIIRNHIAHNSDKAKNKFHDLSKKYLNKKELSQGWSVGQLLLKEPKTSLGFTQSQVNNLKVKNNFEAFIYILQNLSNKFAIT